MYDSLFSKGLRGEEGLRELIAGPGNVSAHYCDRRHNYVIADIALEKINDWTHELCRYRKQY